MTVTVYVWDYRGSKEAWGHAAANVEDGKKTAYITWWPNTGEIVDQLKLMPNIYSARPFRNRTHEEDIFDERTETHPSGKPNHVIALKGLDEQAIFRWWDRFSKSTAVWSTASQNCSTVVATALKMGGSDRYVGWWRWDSWNVVWHPDDVRAYAFALREALVSAGKMKRN